jgi:hypothetical protein
MLFWMVTPSGLVDMGLNKRFGKAYCLNLQAHREDGDPICLHFSFRKESRLKCRVTVKVDGTYSYRSALKGCESTPR